MNISTTANPIPEDASRSLGKLEVVLSQASGVRIKESCESVVGSQSLRYYPKHSTSGLRY